MDNIQTKSFILGAMLMLASQTFAAQKPLHVSVGDSGVKVFSPDAPVQGLRTFRQAVLGSLIQNQGSQNLKGDLLERFYWDFDNKWYVLTLKKGLKFHNGRAVHAKDLEFSLVRGLFTKRATWFKSFLTNIEGLENAANHNTYKPGVVSGVAVLDAHSVRVKLSHPNPSFLHSLTMPILSLVPAEELKADLLTWKKHPIGAGPYKVSRVNTKTNEVTVQKLYGSGPNEVQFSTRGIDNESDIAILGAPEKREMESQTLKTSTSVTGIYFNYDHPLGRDKNFRAAINSLVNRKNLAKDVDEYTPVKQLLASQHWGRIEVGETHSTAKAKKLLSKVKIDKKAIIRVPVFNSNFGKGHYGEYLSALTQQFSDAGLKVEFFDSPKKFFDDSDKKYPLRVISLGADLVDPLVLFTLFSKGSLLKHHRPSNDVGFKKLLDQAKTEESLNKRADSVKKLSKHFYDHNYAVPLFERKPTLFFDNKKVSSLGVQDGGLTFYLDRVTLHE